MRFSLAWLLLASTAAAQITGPTTVKQGEPIVLTVTLAEGERAAWFADAGAGVKAVKGTAHCWGTVGKANVIRCAVIPKDENAEPIPYSHVFTFDGSPAPPTPTLTLKQLAGDQAEKLGTFYAALAKQVAAITTVANFQTVHNGQLAKFGLLNHGAAAEIDRRLASVLVDPLDHTKLRATLEGFAVELGQGPQPPPIPPVLVGKRTVVLLHETSEITPDLSQAIVKMRSGAFAEYLKQKDHTLLILDDDATNPDGAPHSLVAKLKAEGVPPPAAFVLDGQSLLRKAHVDDATADQQVMSLLKEAGG